MKRKKIRSVISTFAVIELKETVDGIALGMMLDRRSLLNNEYFGTVRILKDGVPYYSCGGYEIHTRICLIHVFKDKHSNYYRLVISENDKELFSHSVLSMCFICPNSKEKISFPPIKPKLSA